MAAASYHHKPATIFLPLAALFVGLAVAQFIATAQVYRSNVNLHGKITAVINSGYLAVPNVHVLPSLQSLGTAARGGLFFTLTLGCGLALLSLAAAWIWIRLLDRKRSVLWGGLAAWAVVVIAASAGGFNPWLSAYLLLVPAAVFGVSAWWLPETRRQPAGKAHLIHLLPFVFLALLWAGQIDRELFIDLRDSLLWSNPFGRRVNDFYYTYTLYPAEAFKSLDQKLLKTYSLDLASETADARELERVLANFDYVRVPPSANVDLQITATGDRLVFERRGRVVLQTTMAELREQPQRILSDWAARTDRNRALRRAVFLSLLFAFPAALYIVVHGLLSAPIYPFAKAGTAVKIASCGCLLVGAGIFVPFQLSRSSGVAVAEISTALESQRWQDRVAALRLIEDKELDVAQYPAYDTLRRSPLLAERYWFARSLASSRQPQSYSELLALLDDSELNVRTMAMLALGRRGVRTAVPEILKRLASSNIWYDQLYAYQALRKLGWKQPTSNSTR